MASNNFNKKILQIGDQSKQIYKQSVIPREHHMVLSYLQGHVWQRGGESHLAIFLICSPWNHNMSFPVPISNLVTKIHTVLLIVRP